MGKIKDWFFPINKPRDGDTVNINVAQDSNDSAIRVGEVKINVLESEASKRRRERQEFRLMLHDLGKTLNPKENPMRVRDDRYRLMLQREALYLQTTTPEQYSKLVTRLEYYETMIYGMPLPRGKDAFSNAANE